jgi:ATP-dependent helicase/DNAse subunit B
MTNATYIHVKNKTKADGISDIMPYDAYEKLEDFAKNKLIEMADSLKQGNIQAIPKGEKGRLACEYCDYWSVCGNYNTDKAQLIDKADADKLREIIGIKLTDEAGEEDER